MKLKLQLVSLIAILGLAMAFKGDKPLLAFGAEAPLADVKMEDISGASYSLDDLKKENGLLVIFSCNTCPFVLGWEDQYPKLKEQADAHNIGMVLVNSNEKKREGDDSMEAMKKHAKEAGYTMPYVVDANNRLADAFGARTTPHVFMFNAAMELVYRGSINDKYENRSKEAEDHFLMEAIEALGAGKEIDPADTRELGCSIKRV
jgi:peroxiredoxin